MNPPRRRQFVIVAMLVLVAVIVVVAFGAGGGETAPVTLDPERGAAEAPASTLVAGGAAARTSGTAEDDTPVPRVDDGVGEREVVEAVDAPPHPKLANVIGYVVDEDARPVEGARVRLDVRKFPLVRRSYRAETAADGSFRLTDIPPGRAGCNVSAKGLCSIELRTVQLEKGTVFDFGAIEMARGTEVDGLVRIDGKPAPGIQMLLMRKFDERVSTDGVAVMTNREGRFKSPKRLQPGHYRVIAMPNMQFGPFALRRDAKLVAAEFDIVSGQPRHTVYVDLRGDG